MTTQQSQPGSFSPKPEEKSSWLFIGLILAAATFLFTFRLGSEGLWIDELSSIRDASAFENPLKVYSASRIRPLYYVLLSVWMRFGSSDVWLRSLSVVFAVLSVYLIYRLGRRIAGETEGLVAAMLLAASPLFVNHAQEVRMYVLSLCMGIAGTLFLVNALLVERSQKPKQKDIGGWVIFRLLAMLAVPLNITLLLPDFIFILLRFRKERDVLLSFAKWSVLLVLVWLPAIPPILKDADPNSAYAVDRQRYLDRPGLGNLIYPLKYWMVSPQVVYLGKPISLFYKLFTLLVAGLLGAGLLQKHKTPAVVWTVAWFILPLLPIIAFSWISAQLWEPRYVLFVSPYLFLLIAVGFTRLWKQWKIAAIIAAVIYALAMGGALAHYYNVQNRSDYRFNVESIEQNEQPGDGIVWGYEWDNPFTYYYDGSNELYWRPMFDVDTVEGIQPWLDSFPTEHQRLWLVLDDTRPIGEEFEAAINEAYTVEETIEFEAWSKIMLLTPRNNAPSIPTSATPSK